MTRPTIVSLSTIPSRFHLLEPTLKSLLSQSLKPQEIRIYIPMEYRRFQNWDGVLPPVPEGISIVRCDMDYGPATKVLPAARDLKGQNIDILFCDDDKVYDAGWHERFKDASIEHPNTCIVEVGESFPDIADDCRPADRLPRGGRRRKDLQYRLRRIFSLFTQKPYLTVNGYVDQISGYAGVLVQPEWFDDLFYDIPDVMWTVDDPWISGHLERIGIPIWMNGFVKRPAASENGAFDALHDLVEQGYDRVSADLLVIDYFRNTYNIWKACGKVDKNYKQRASSSMRELARRALISS
ncbi:glycosyltransferase family 2 protein [Brucella sp. 2280]|uniref:glycosyltransferase family 2 protein n=1 Tax=Brucella sp. 2280 TaxID=2592625 RepID=UPI0012971341|nr:glycosyltransferase family 2 protein [Brucella sp. 2280]QGA58120.1 glycosyltransferase family 2 protein [Brucella sp. 2280]